VLGVFVEHMIGNNINCCFIVVEEKREKNNNFSLTLAFILCSSRHIVNVRCNAWLEFNNKIISNLEEI
jgi:hypothetical protein